MKPDINISSININCTLSNNSQIIAKAFNNYFTSMLIKRSNLMQQYADIYSLHSHSTCFGCHSTRHQEY